jgi:phosphatidylglycerophosphate synthase
MRWGRGAFAHVLTLSRLPLAAALWWCVDDARAFYVVVAVAALTDLVDGYVARHTGGATSLGAWLDPLCDKVFVVSAVAVSIVVARPPAGWLVLLLLREFILLPVMAAWLVWRRRLGAVDFRAVTAGKLTTVAQFAGVVALREAPRWLPWAAIVAGVLGVVSVVVVVRRALRAAASARDAPAPPDGGVAPSAGDRTAATQRRRDVRRKRRSG